MSGVCQGCGVRGVSGVCQGFVRGLSGMQYGEGGKSVFWAGWGGGPMFLVHSIQSMLVHSTCTI